MTKENKGFGDSQASQDKGYGFLLLGVLVILAAALGLAAYTLFSTHMSNLPRFNPPN